MGEMRFKVGDRVKYMGTTNTADKDYIEIQNKIIIGEVIIITKVFTGGYECVKNGEPQKITFYDSELGRSNDYGCKHGCNECREKCAFWESE